MSRLLTGNTGNVSEATGHRETLGRNRLKRIIYLVGTQNFPKSTISFFGKFCMRTKSVIPKTVIKIFIIYVIRLRKLKLGLLASGFKVFRSIGKYLFKVSNKYTRTQGLRRYFTSC